jgi:hypothetical protein
MDKCYEKIAGRSRVIVALGVVWTGGAWYTGKQLESRIADMVQQANAQLRSSAPQAGAELSGLSARAVPQPFTAGAEADAGQARWLAAGRWCLMKSSITAPSRWPR